jgi:rSAM/selenodomain-associated transferase 2
MTPRDVSVVIPAINEEVAIVPAIESAFDAGAGEVILADGGSSDQTVEQAKQHRVSKVVHSLPGRGTQMNAGAALADREFVLFLHADNVLTKECLEQLCDHSVCVWGAYRQRIDSPRRVYRWIEYGNAKRVQMRGMAFGDQAIFVRTDAFRKAGGFADISLMEDVELSRRLRGVAKPVLLLGPVKISARRWEKNGVIRQTLLNWRLQLQYAMGASPEKLRRKYS